MAERGTVGMKRLKMAVAWALYLAALYLALAFTTYDPDAGLGNPKPVNLGGPLGAWFAGKFVASFGVGAYVLCFFLVYVGFVVQSGRAARVHALKLVGLTVTMITFGAFCQAALLGRLFPGGEFPLGGILGKETVDKLNAFWGRPWTLVAMGLGVVAGLLLMTEHLLPDLFRRQDRGRAPKSRPKKRGGPKSARGTPTVAAGQVEDDEVDSPAEDDADDEELEKALARRRAQAEAAQSLPPIKAKERSRKAAPKAEVVDAEDAAGDDGDSEDFESEAEEELDDAPEEAAVREPAVAEDAADAEPVVPALVNPPQIRAAANLNVRDGIEVIRLTPDPKLRGKEKYELPPLSLLAEPKFLEERESDEEIRGKAVALEQALLDYGVTAKVEEIERGPVITRFDISIARGTKITKVTSLADELAMSLGVQRVRIAPVKGRPVLGVEIPNRERETVYLKELVLATDLRKRKLAVPLFLGKDAAGNPMVEDIASTPHLLIAGRTGAGKSVFVNDLVVSILLTRYPEEVRLIMIDPKKVELEVYQDIPHLLTKVESNPKKAAKILEWAVNQMEERYELLAATGVRHLTSYNKLTKTARVEKLSKIYSPEEIEKLPEHLPYVVIIVDELADLMMASGKEVEQAIARLAQKARAVGIHVVLATQRPSTDVITGLIKSNLPARIAFQTRTGIDSRTILDRYGAEKLLDKGDMLYLGATSDDPKRIQGPFVSDEEVEAVVAYLREKASPMYTHHLEQVSSAGTPEATIAERDELFEAAVDLVLASGQASASHLQTRMNVGYARARRLVEMMGEAGFVGPAQGAKPREILLTPEKWEEVRARLFGANAPKRSGSEVLTASADEDE